MVAETLRRAQQRNQLRRRPPLGWLWLAAPASIIGASPWLEHNVGHGMPSLDRPPQPEHVSYLGGIGRLLWRTLPIALNRLRGRSRPGLRTSSA